MIRGIKFTTIPVRDQEEALEFYTKKLGMEILTDQPFDDKQRWIELGIPGADTGVVLFTPEGHESRIGSFQGLSFWTDDVNKTYAELTARGVKFDKPPMTADWGTSSVFVDQDGNKFALSSK
jgi:catechol 2,3-dioxygenase-like lactoylglutathione lyase family enzyme